MADSLVASMLLTDAYGGFGGIAQFNRDFLRALDACELVERVRVLPRLIPERIAETIPESVIYDRTAAEGKSSFARRVLRHVWSPNSTNLVICGHLNLLPLAWLLARSRRTRLALIIYGIEAWTSPTMQLVATLARKIDSVISISEITAARFCEWSGVDPKRTHILPCCVDLEKFAPRSADPGLVKRYGLENSRVIMTTGRLAAKERYKGFDEVIDVLPQLAAVFPDLKYLIVGDGSDRGRLVSKAEAMGVSDRVIFTGYIPESEKVAHYSLADAYVMPSSGEGFGIVLIEAAACGVPVVGSNADGSREALLGGQLGRLVDPKRPDELVVAVVDLLKRPRQRVRPRGIETLATPQFESRVATWLREQAISIQ